MTYRFAINAVRYCDTQLFNILVKEKSIKIKLNIILLFISIVGSSQYGVALFLLNTQSI